VRGERERPRKLPSSCVRSLESLGFPCVAHESCHVRLFPLAIPLSTASHFHHKMVAFVSSGTFYTLSLRRPPSRRAKPTPLSASMGARGAAFTLRAMLLPRSGCGSPGKGAKRREGASEELRTNVYRSISPSAKRVLQERAITLPQLRKLPKVKAESALFNVFISSSSPIRRLFRVF